MWWVSWWFLICPLFVRLDGKFCWHQLSVIFAIRVAIPCCYSWGYSLSIERRPPQNQMLINSYLGGISQAGQSSYPIAISWPLQPAFYCLNLWNLHDIRISAYLQLDIGYKQRTYSLHAMTWHYCSIWQSVHPEALRHPVVGVLLPTWGRVCQSWSSEVKLLQKLLMSPLLLLSVKQ